jgi:hypothetical protein
MRLQQVFSVNSSLPWYGLNRSFVMSAFVEPLYLLVLDVLYWELLSLCDITRSGRRALVLIYRLRIPIPLMALCYFFLCCTGLRRWKTCDWLCKESCQMSCYWLVVHVDGVSLCVWTEATSWPVVHPQHEKWVCRATMEWYWQRNRRILIKHTPVPLSTPQIPRELTRVRTRASAVRGRRLIAWAMARPMSYCYKLWGRTDFSIIRVYSVILRSFISLAGYVDQSWDITEKLRQMNRVLGTWETLWKLVTVFGSLQE